jgi:hypothetical protein
VRKGIGRILTFHGQEQDVIGTPVDLFWPIDHKGWTERDQATWGLNPQSGSGDGTPVITSSDEADLMSVLKQSSTDHSANRACPKDDESHLVILAKSASGRPPLHQPQDPPGFTSAPGVTSTPQSCSNEAREARCLRRICPFPNLVRESA